MYHLSLSLDKWKLNRKLLIITYLNCSISELYETIKIVRLAEQTNLSDFSEEWNNIFICFVSSMTSNNLIKKKSQVLLPGILTIFNYYAIFFHLLFRMLKEIYQSATHSKATLDDFMGLVEVPLKVSLFHLTQWHYNNPVTILF